jgi:hypothetical protein
MQTRTEFSFSRQTVQRLFVFDNLKTIQLHDNLLCCKVKKRASSLSVHQFSPSPHLGTKHACLFHLLLSPHHCYLSRVFFSCIEGDILEFVLKGNCVTMTLEKIPGDVNDWSSSSISFQHTRYTKVTITRRLQITRLRAA